MSEYYIQREGARHGPFDEETVLREREQGRLRDDDLIWAEGLADWVPVSEVFAELGAGAGFLDLEPLEDAPEPDHGEQPRPYRAAPENPLQELPHVGDVSYGYAGFWVRFGAVAIDNLVLLVLFAAVGVGLKLAGVSPYVNDFRVDLVSLAVTWLYFAGQEGGRHSATLGKRVFNLEVRLAHNLEPFGFMLGTARYGVSILSALLLLIGYLIQPFTPKKQAMHDLATGTVVIVCAPYSRLLLGCIIALPFLLILAAVTVGIFLGAAEQGWL